MFSKKNKKKAFTLIEMLIVIVIIGILMAAIYPRLSNARGRANDVARKADLAQVAAALVAYQIDHGSFPLCGTTSGCSLIAISGDLISAGMSSIPSDPQATKTFAGLSTSITSGQYGYTTIKKGGISNNGFVLMAGVETEGGANFVVGTGVTDINTNTDSNDIDLCKSFNPTGTAGNGSTGVCTYNKTADQLRYIYVY